MDASGIIMKAASGLLSPNAIAISGSTNLGRTVSGTGWRARLCVGSISGSSRSGSANSQKRSPSQLDSLSYDPRLKLKPADDNIELMRQKSGGERMRAESMRWELDQLPTRSSLVTREEKQKYGYALSSLLAVKVAKGLRPDFAGILPTDEGKFQESKARAARGPKKLDVNYSKSEIGLGLGVSIRTINFKDPKQKHYKKNISRNDNELRAEAQDYHERQPYAVMVALIFLPSDCFVDATSKSPSSFGRAVQYFRLRAGRTGPSDSPFLFEEIYIGVYEDEGPDRGSVTFFDVFEKPPWSGRPKESSLLSMGDVFQRIKLAYDRRNDPPFEWADED